MTDDLNQTLRFHAPYMEWAKTRRAARFDLAGSNILPCSIDDLTGAREAIALDGHNESGYAPLLESIAARYGVPAAHVTTAQGASGANFLVCAALLAPGDDVLIERPGYDPLLGAPRLLGARVRRFDRAFSGGFALDPDRVRRAITPQTRLVILSSPHNPTGVRAGRAALQEIARLAESNRAHVLVDEVYLDAADAVRGDDVTKEVRLKPDTTEIGNTANGTAAALDEVFIVTSSLTKSYGLSGLRCGWALSAPAVAERIRRARDVVDGTGSIVAERLAALAFSQLDRLIARSLGVLRINAPLVREFLRSRPELEWVEPDGSTVVFPRLRGIGDASVFAQRLLDERDTAIVPGRFFEAPEHFRVGFGGTTAALRAGLVEVAAALDARAW